MAKCFSFWVVVCLTVLIPNNLNKNDILALADLDLGNVYVDVNLDPDENPTSSQLTSLEVEDRDPLDTDQSFDYKEEDDEWYYDPEAAHVKGTQTVSSTIVTSRPALDASSQNVDTGAVADMNKPETKTEIPLTVVKEDPLSIKDVHVKKPLQAPKGTIILYTAIIVVFIACIVLFSAWKNPFNNGRPLHQHQTPIIRTGEEGKRLLDHPFV